MFIKIATKFTGHRYSYYIINGITVYRIIASVALLLFILNKQYDLFKWLLPVSFFTDLIDGFLARKYGVTSILGAKLDSIGDDVTVVVAMIGVIFFKKDFFYSNLHFIIIMLSLWAIQTATAFYRYGKFTAFHTYLAKLAALFQGLFLILLFILKSPPYFLFYLASTVTILDLIEEIILVLMLRNWQANIKGVYWIAKKEDINGSK